MIENICNVALEYTSLDFENWTVGIGTILIGLGTIGIAWGAVKSIPDRISAQHKDKEIITLYQRAIYRMYMDVAASTKGMPFNLPKDLDKLTDILIQKYPFIGDKKSVERLMDDLMEDNYFQYVQGNATVLKTTKWDSGDRSKKVNPKIEDLPKD